MWGECVGQFTEKRVSGSVVQISLVCYLGSEQGRVLCGSRHEGLQAGTASGAAMPVGTIA